MKKLLWRETSLHVLLTLTYWPSCLFLKLHHLNFNYFFNFACLIQLRPKFGQITCPVSKLIFKGTQGPLDLLKTYTWICIFNEYSLNQITDIETSCPLVLLRDFKQFCYKYLRKFCLVIHKNQPQPYALIFFFHNN